MAIPVFPVFTGQAPKIINKTIVYSDTVLPLKDLGKNLSITSIKNINEESLENCLNIIFESNPDVTFNTISYSKNNKTVYFYTDKEISKKEYEESKYTKHKSITNSKEILEEIKSNLENEENSNENNISLYDIANIIRYYEKKYEQTIKEYTSICKKILKQNSEDASIIIHNFDYQNNELEIAYKDWLDKYKHITFKKENGDLYITRSEGLFSQEIFNSIGNYLSDLYDELMKFKDYKNFEKAIHDIKPVNSNFLVYIGNFGVDIHSISNYLFALDYDFELRAHNFNSEYSYGCNSNNILSILKGNEDLLFKKIYVKIDDCPNWIKEDLYNVRKKQLEEEKRKEEERLKEESKHQRKLELKRKFFPWIKK